MADVTRTIDIIFGAVDNTSSGIGSVGAGLSSLESSVGAMTGPLADLTGSLFKAEAAVLALGAAFTAVAVQQAGTFVAGINEIGTLFQGTTEEIRTFNADVREFASTSVSSLEDITGATYSAVSAGIAYKDVLGVLSDAEKLSVAAKADLNDTIVTVASSLNAYGKSTEEAGDFSDALFTAVRYGQTTLPELAQSLGLVSSTAASAGISFDDLLAAVAGLTAGGVQTSQSMSGIKAAISNVLKPTKDATLVAKELGIEFSAAGIQAKGFAGFVKEIQEKTGGAIEPLSKLFGSTEALTVMLALTGRAAGKFNDALEGMKERTGAVDAAFTIMENNIDKVLQKLVNNMRLTLIQAGTPLLEQFGATTAELTDTFKQLTFSFEQGAFDPLLDVVKGFGLDMENILADVAANIPEALALNDKEFKELGNSFVGIRDAIGGVFEGVDLSTPKGLALVIKFITDTLTSLNKIVAEVIVTLTPFARDLFAIGKAFIESEDSAKELVAEVLAFGTALNTLLPIVGGVGIALTGLSTVIGTLAAAKYLGVSSGIGGIATSASKLIPLLGPLGIGAAAIAAGIALGTFAEETLGIGTILNDVLAPDVIFGDGATLGTAAFDLIQGIKDIGKQSYETQLQIALLNKANTETIKQSGELVQAYKDIGSEYRETALSAEDWTGINKDLTASFKDQGLHIDATTGKVQTLKEHQEEIAKSTDAAKKSTEKWVKILDDNGELLGYEDIGTSANKYLGEHSKSLDTAAKKTKELSEETDAFRIKMEEIASNERIKTIESKVELDIAQLETDANVAIEVADNIADAFAQSSDIVAGIFGGLGDIGGFYGLEKLEIIESQLEKENEFRDKALDSQLKLNDANIKLLQARAKALSGGKALIEVDGSGLTPHLEGFMFEVLKAIQIKANAEGVNYLLGA